MSRQSNYLVIFLCLGITILMATGCSPSGSLSDEIDEVELPLGYIPNIQFAPLYVAMEKGYYRDEGIQLTLNYSFEIDSVGLVGADELQFAMVSGEQVLLARDKGLPVVYVMEWYEDFPVGIAVLADSGINRLSDLKGKMIGLPALQGASYIGLIALLNAAGLTEADLTIEVIGYSQVEMLATGRVDAAVVYVANEPIQLAAEGYDVRVFPVSDSMSLVGNGLLTNEKTMKEQPELVERMIKATLKGIRYAAENPDEAYEISKKYVENLAEADESVQKAVLSASIDLWSASIDGNTDLGSWENMSQVMNGMGLTKISEGDLENSFSNLYLP